MRRLAQGLAFTLAALCCSGAATAEMAADDVRQANILAMEKRSSPCGGSRHAQVTLALPDEYQAQASDIQRTRGTSVCGRIVYGSTYQVLSWLENGAVQAAVLPAFAVSVMRAEDPLRFRREFYDLPTLTVSTVPRLERQILLLDADYSAVENAEAKLVDFFAALRASAAGKSMWLPSHLSPAVPYLLRSAARWANEQQLTGAALDEFYGALIGAIRFGRRAEVDAAPLAPGGLSYHLLDAPYGIAGKTVPAPRNQLQTNRLLAVDLSDRIILRKRVLLASRELREVVAESRPVDEPDSSEAIPLFAQTMLEEIAMGANIARFRETNYRRVQFGAVAQRHFRFTIAELWSLLQHADDGSSSDRMALVLTGGGVKAAYQTRVIDYLYQEGLLVNAGGATAEPAKAQRVDYVIGTSGGALLGVFVAAMNETFDKARSADAGNSLTSILWKEPGAGISSGDVFPFLDMMRYATLIVALVIVWLVAAATLSLFRSSFRQVTRFDHSDESFFGRRARAFRESWPWILLLVAAPILIVKVANVNRVEHVPTETGLYYAIMALIAFYSDVRLYPIKPFQWLRSRFTLRTVALLVAGLAAIATALWRPGALAAISPFEYEGLIFVNLCCAGFVALILGVHYFFHDQTGYFRPEARQPIFRALGVLLGIVLLAYLGVSFAMWLEATSLLEMHGGFWKYFLALTAILTGVFMWLARAPDARMLNWPQATAGYLFSEYRSRALFGSERRYMRFLTLTIVAWVWWNALAAPALYGNRNARDYLEGAFRRYTALALPDVNKQIDAQLAARERDRRDNKILDDLQYAVEFPLAVPFVITATSLEKGQERYFLFMSGSDEHIDRLLDPEAWFEVVRDPRWVVVRKPVDRELQHAAFASGSPFPVFSAHDVKLRSLNSRGERLIDGGFAHNKPLEAALALGASKVLVLNSSPLEAMSGGGCTVAALSLGELACNIPKLLPYLWERSQVEDLLSTRRMMVASIYPTATRGYWPSLTDFRRETVRQLVQDAGDDRLARVGVIESWGAPDLRTEQLIYYDKRMIISEIRESQQ